MMHYTLVPLGTKYIMYLKAHSNNTKHICYQDKVPNGTIKIENHVKFFSKTRQKSLEQGKTANPAFAKALLGTYLKYGVGEIVLVVIDRTILCPVRDKTWVETNNEALHPRAFRYEIYNVPKGTCKQHNSHLLPR
ncbi:hypothetical protein U1E44_08160 [Arenibacter sp. GZD96]|uniref:hypothetical protein n=1 Tax=Aurantibrevibacter litoralis TaxID=3106030 RepID=UPI002AFE1E24|nr:hypothetical protein [Arenibacter sp. GZD-96]MEA1786060.1 hypothetical protein [Arenibacter sp. GZD-96]